jgi:histidyl-tRNA synthetase
MDSLNALSIKTQEDPFLVRGLDYYIRTAFEVHSSDLGAQNAVAGGGRYDGLVSFLGGSDTPAIGFALGVERLVMLLREKSQISPVAPEYYLAPITEEALALALQISHALRKKGKSVQTDFQPTRLKTHLKKAQRMNASEVIIIGDPELSTRTALVKNLLSGEQTSVPFEDLLNLTS